MTDDIAIRVRGLGKKYTIGGPQEKYQTLRDAIVNSVKAPFRRLTRLSADQSMNEFWALKDVYFDVHKGEVIGIIGRNGAGKSTLLKILSRITTPTEGEVNIYGRVGSLLEVGTGFHPELTGRENIFLSGSILGMRKQEIEEKFDEIVKFAEIERFIETPVKRYSSGMYVRLAFAVAAHLEPEILIIDEVLAVGDAGFQKKCLGKMGDVAKEGRTVLFVSHNMAAIKLLCPRTIYLSEGKMVMDDSSQKVINFYIYGQSDQKGDEQLSSKREYGLSSAPGDEFVRLRRVCFVSSDESSKSSFRMDEEFSIEIECTILKDISNFQLYIRVHNNDGILAFCSSEWDGGDFQGTHHDPGQYKTRITIPPHLLNSGIYTLSVMGLIYSVRIIFEESDVLMWKINRSGGVGGVVSMERQGIFRPLLLWSQRSVK
jgi:lipopolysaccharide transport system ATP-binding protein